MLPTCHEKFHKSVGLKKIHELLFIIFNYFFYFVAAETFEKSPNFHATQQRPLPTKICCNLTNSTEQI